jgi:hypothetical protein
MGIKGKQVAQIKFDINKNFFLIESLFQAISNL